VRFTRYSSEVLTGLASWAIVGRPSGAGVACGVQLRVDPTDNLAR
jgi:hypothetical protein